MSNFVIIVNEAAVSNDSLGTTSTPGVSNYVTLEQVKRAVLVDDEIENFTIENFISAEGPLPYSEIFVLQVVNEDDPKDDVFTRVATIADLTTLVKGRAAAGAATDDETYLYLDNVVTLTYETLDVAIAGQQAIKDRVNELVKQWILYEEDFEAYPTAEITYLPVGDASTLDQLITVYTAAKQDRVNKEELLEDATRELTQAQEDQILFTGLYNNLSSFASRAVDRTQEISAVRTALNNLITTANATTFTPDISIPITAATTALAQANIDVADHAQYATDLQVYTATILTEKQIADANVITASTNFNVATQNLEDAVEAEADALADVIEICPDFDADSVVVAPTV